DAGALTTVAFYLTAGRGARLGRELGRGRGRIVRDGGQAGRRVAHRARGRGGRRLGRARGRRRRAVDRRDARADQLVAAQLVHGLHGRRQRRDRDRLLDQRLVGRDEVVVRQVGVGRVDVGQPQPDDLARHALVDRDLVGVGEAHVVAGLRVCPTG